MDENDDLRALVVDDGAVIRSYLRIMLHHCGINDIDEAENGEAALEKLNHPDSAPPDFIITDLHMDKMDGLELLNLIRRGKTRIMANTPVLILTGDQEPLVKEVSQQVGATVYLSKPIAEAELSAALKKIFHFLTL